VNSRGCFNNHLVQYCYHITSRQVANTKRSHFRGYIVLTHGSIYILRFFGANFVEVPKWDCLKMGSSSYFLSGHTWGFCSVSHFQTYPKCWGYLYPNLDHFLSGHTHGSEIHMPAPTVRHYSSILHQRLYGVEIPLVPPQYIIPNTSHKPFFGGFKLIWNRQWGLFSVRGMGLFYLVLRANHSKVVRALLTCLEVADDSLSFCERDGWRAVSVAAAWWGGWWVGLWFKFKR